MSYLDFFLVVELNELSNFANEPFFDVRLSLKWDKMLENLQVGLSHIFSGNKLSELSFEFVD